MGLTMEVGLLADFNEHDPEAADWVREDLKAINKLLAHRGLGPHNEPEVLPEPQWRVDTDGCPYESIHYLRRFYSRCKSNPGWRPVPLKDEEDPLEDEFYNKEVEKLESHLVCHSDAEGYYLPIDFAPLLMGEEEGEVTGDIVGSSYQLMRELVSIAPKLGIELINGELTDDAAEKLNEQIENEDQFQNEKLAWFNFFESARLSIEHKSVIAFQ